MKKYYMGIDGGNSKTQIVIIDEALNVICDITGKPSSIELMDLTTSVNIINETYHLNNLGLPITGVFAGIAGVIASDYEQEYERLFRKLPFIKDNASIVIKSDRYTSLLSKDATLEGIALILGTSSSCFGFHNEVGFRVGGYPYQEGDAGSAYDLGNQALKYYARVLDKRIPESNFSNEIANVLEINNITDLDNYFNHFNRVSVAKLAPIVTKFAPINQYAYHILATAADEVKMMVEAVYKTIGFDETSLVFSGGLIQAETMYRQLVFQNIKKVNSNIQIQTPLYSPAQGAAIFAQKNLK
jgi:N-acetylglucosamine kinase-like BadF-type ATPase